MNTRLLFAPLLVILMNVPLARGDAWSQQMKQELTAPPPDWLSVGAPIKVERAAEMTEDPAAFRPLSGDSESTRDRVILPVKGIEIKVDDPIKWVPWQLPEPRWHEADHQFGNAPQGL